jgi:hypothetical protein
MPHAKTGRIVAAICTLALLAVYGVTLAPSLTWSHYGDDGGDLVTAVAQGSIPHPPGFPTYLLLGELFIRIPWGELAWRLNLMSAVCAAGAAGLTATAIIRNPQSAICAGLCLGLAPLFWSQALIAEVYAPAALFAALVMALCVGKGPAWAVGLSWGAGLGVHPTLLFLAPLVAWEIWREPNNRLRRLAAACLPALLMCGILYGPALLARGSVPSPWGDVSTFDGWWGLVSARLYRGYVFGLPLKDYPLRLLAWAGLLARQFTPVGAIVAGLGMVRLRRAQRPLALASALAFGALSIYAIGYNTTDSLVYLAAALPLAALWLGIGLTQVADWLNRRLPRGAWALLLLPLLQALLFGGQMDVSKDRSAMDWAAQVLQQAPPQAILLTEQDNHTFTLWYVHDVLGERPDVAVIDVDMWGQEHYRRMMADTLGIDANQSSLSPEEAVRQTGRPVVYVTDLTITERESP